jgi:ABC-2 type transport system permease protein
LSAELGFVALFATVFGISTVHRLRTEEAAGRAEELLATRTSRLRLAASHAVVALVGTTVLTVAVGLGTGLTHAGSAGNGGMVGQDLAAALVRLPAVWVLVALSLAVYGLAGRWVSVTWGVLVGALVVGQFGDLMNLPQWTQDLSPYAHVPQLPGGTLDASGMVALVGVAAVLGAIGLAAFHRRDLTAD